MVMGPVCTQRGGSSPDISIVAISTEQGSCWEADSLDLGTLRLLASQRGSRLVLPVPTTCISSTRGSPRSSRPP